MRVHSSDRAWEQFGQKDPYFGVASHPRFRDASHEGPERQEFMASGERHVEQILEIARGAFGVLPPIRRALDFGCGVGRILIPLARRADRAVGVDVSTGMLDEASANCAVAGVENVELLLSDDTLSRVSGRFDLIHSYIVFQHIPPRRGEALIRRLLTHLEDDGLLCLHVTYGKRISPWRRAVQWGRRSVPGLHGIVNLLQGRAFRYPLMQMNDYDLNALLRAFQEAGLGDLHLRVTDHGGYLGALIFGRRAAPFE